MAAEYCNSCTMPLNMPDAKGASDIYCKYCSDETGQLKPRADVERGIAHWLGSWQPSVDADTALVRARHFMNAMPAWAER